MPDTHTCPCGCGGQVARTRFACRAGWFRLPRSYRDAIQRGYSCGALSTTHVAAMRAAMAWYEQHPLKPTRTVICGSLTCQAAIDTAAAYYRREGHQVLAPTPDPTRTPAEHDQRWLDAIAQADLVVIVPKPDGTLGEQTTRELAKAGEHNRPVAWWTELPAGGAR